MSHDIIIKVLIVVVEFVLDVNILLLILDMLQYLEELICYQIGCCKGCLKVVASNRCHVWGEIYYKICNKDCSSDYLCFIQAHTNSPPDKDLIFIFYNLETRQ